MLQPPQWVGWKNYLRLFLADDVFLIAVKNTFVFAVITGPVSYLASFVFAWLINDLRPKIRAVLTLLLYAPSIAGSLYLIWTIIFSGDAYGLINSRLLYLGIIKDPIQFLTDPEVDDGCGHHCGAVDELGNQLLGVYRWSAGN